MSTFFFENLALNKKKLPYQEVPFTDADTIQADVTDYFDQRGYHWLGKARSAAAAHGCAIFYRRLMFTLETWKAVESRVGDKRRRRTVGVVCRLRAVDVAVTARLVVASVHLLHGRRNFVERMADISVLLAGITF